MNQPIIQFSDVTVEFVSRTGLFKQFKHRALDSVSLSVNKGDVFGVLGKNGSGKSTLLKVLAGIFEPDQGQVHVSSSITRSLLALGLGFNPNLTGRDNALISCMLNGLSKTQAADVLEEIKSFSGLGKFFELPVKAYSSGMKSRLGFSSGIILEVDLLLIDEVLSVGDSNFIKKAEKTLLNKLKGDQTVVFVSHNQKQIKRLCNAGIWLHEGKVMAAGDTADVLKSYNSKEQELTRNTLIN